MLKSAALVVERLRKVAVALERRRHPEPIDRAARRPRTILVRVKEKQLVLAARFPNRPSDGVAPVGLLGYRLRIAILLIHPAVHVPVRVPVNPIGRAPEEIGSALGHHRDLQAAGPAVFGLIALRQDLDLGNRIRVQRKPDAAAPGVDDRDAVHDVVALASPPMRTRSPRPGSWLTPGASSASEA